MWIQGKRGNERWETGGWRMAVRMEVGVGGEEGEVRRRN